MSVGFRVAATTGRPRRRTTVRRSLGSERRRPQAVKVRRRRARRQSNVLIPVLAVAACCWVWLRLMTGAGHAASVDTLEGQTGLSAGVQDADAVLVAPAALARFEPVVIEPSSDVARPVAASAYAVAGLRYGISPSLLRALHEVESSASDDACLPNLEGSGAIGPFQFMPSTFRAYGVDADADGRANICGFVDSLHSAAHYLKALGADGRAASLRTRRALERYGTDAERVVTLAYLR